MPDSPRRTGESFALERLRADPTLDYESVHAAARDAGATVLPIHYGRARRRLGIVAGDSTARPSRDAEADADDDSAPIANATSEPKKGLTKPSTPAFEFLVESLQEDPTLSYGELKARADGRELKVAPIMYGRAKALLGLVPVRPRGQGKARKTRDRSSGAHGTPKVPHAETAEKFAAQLEHVRDPEGLIHIVKELDRERRQLRAALQRIADLIDEILN